MAVDIRFIIDGQDRGQPLNPEDFGVTVNEDDSITARVVSFDNDLIFGGDVYNYLFTKLTQSGYCELVNLRIDYLCGSVWQKLLDGYIIVTESIFNYDKCQVKTKVYDQTFSTRINNNKSIPFSMNVSETKNGQPITPPVKRTVRIFNPPTFPFPVYEDAGTGVSVYDALKHLVGCMSDNLVAFESNYFAAPLGTSDMDVLTNGRNIRTNVSTEIVISFEQLFTALRSKFNVGMGFELLPSGQPLLRIEDEAYFYQTTPTANLYNQPGIEMNFDTARLYASVQFGNETVLEQNECGDGSQPCTFTQTPFRGFRNESFGFTGECNTSNVLNIETRAVIFDANTIEDIYRFDNNSHDNDNIILQCALTAGVLNRFEVKATDPYGIGQGVYNGRYTNLNVSANWIQGYPNSLFSFLQEPFLPSQTQARGEVNNDVQTWDVVVNTPILFSAFNGNYIQFNTETDPNNLFDSIDYVCPFAGIYTVTSELIYGFLEPLNGGINRRSRLRLAHFDANDNIIDEVYGNMFADSGSTDVIIPATGTFVCNAGDILRVDAEVNYLTVVSSSSMTQRILDTITLSGVDRFSFVEFSAVPLLTPDIEPVNIDDVRAYLYKFSRPLTMTEISSILGNTSNPINIGRRNDPLSVIPAYIKSLNIASVLRKNAEFTLKSNRLLQ